MNVKKHCLTSRRKSPLKTSFAIDHGIGNVVVTFRALLILKTSVNNNSIPAWIATPMNMLATLTPITWYHSGLLPPLFLAPCTPPVSVGNADAPCLLSPTARLGNIESNIRNSSEGTRKKRRRTPRVPTTSTLSGGWERTWWN